MQGVGESQGWAAQDGGMPGCVPAWLGQNKFSLTGSPSPVQSSRDLTVEMWFS